MGQIARGDVTQSEIVAATGMKSLGGQMKVLEENYGIIRKKRPIGAKEGSQTVSHAATSRLVVGGNRVVRI